jgi:urea transport system ATP-binding protein
VSMPNPIPSGAPAESILYLEGVSVSFEGFKALNSLNLIIRRGEMRAIIGPNGAGKTTMMDIVTGKTRPDSGRVLFGNDVDLTHMDEAQIVNLGIGRKFQKPTVFESLTVFENLYLALKSARSIRETLFTRTEAVARNWHAVGSGTRADAA